MCRDLATCGYLVLTLIFQKINQINEELKIKSNLTICTIIPIVKVLNLFIICNYPSSYFKILRSIKYINLNEN